MTEGLVPDLRAWVEATTGVAIDQVGAIGSGASRQIWAVDLADGDTVVVRVDSGDGPVAGTALTLAREGETYAALRPTDLPVPLLRAVHPEGRALLLDRAPGADGLGGLPVDELRSVAEDLGACLGRLHLLDPADLVLGSLAPTSAADPTVDDIDLWRTIAVTRCAAAASPAVGVALTNLLSTLPEPGRPSLTHGDAGPGNFLHEGGRVTALLDWEFAHVGDPHDDLAWIAVRNQLLGRPLDAATTFASWSTTTGRTIDADRVDWFRALVLTRMLISCDASISWAGPDAPSAQVQVALQPFLAAAVFEALRRAGCPAIGTDGAEADALAVWNQSPIAELLGDPRALDDIGALL